MQSGDMSRPSITWYGCMTNDGDASNDNGGASSKAAETNTDQGTFAVPINAQSSCKQNKDDLPAEPVQVDALGHLIANASLGNSMLKFAWQRYTGGATTLRRTTETK